MKPAYLHRLLLLLFLSGAVMTGFGHHIEMVGLGIIVLALVLYTVRPKRGRNAAEEPTRQPAHCPQCGSSNVSGTCPECGEKVG